MPPTRILRMGAFGIVAAAAIVLVVVFFPWNVLRGGLANYLTARFDRSVTIKGDLAVDLGWTTRVQIDEVSVANVAWSSEQPMIRANRVVLWLTPGSLLRGEPLRAQLVGTNVLLERNTAGENNWHFGAADPAPRLGNVDVERGRVRVRDANGGINVDVELQTMATAPGERAALAFRGRGIYHGEPIELDGRSVGVAQLQNIDDPYRMSLQVRSGRTVISFDGTIVPADTENLRGVLRLQGPDLSKLYPIVPAPLPWTPPYQLAGELTHTKGLWNFRDMKGTVGDTDLSGNVQVDVSKPRSMTTADLTSVRFDSKDLGVLMGAQPAGQPSGQRPRLLAYRVLPDRPLDLAKLRDHDADVKFRGTSVKWSSIPMDSLTAHVRIKDGVLQFQPLDFGIADGHVIANVIVDVTRGNAGARGELEARDVELKRLFPKLASPNGSAGRFSGRAHFEAQGNTVAAMLANVDGDAAVVMRGGEASTLQLVLTNLDLARAAELLLRGDETAEVRCAVGAFHAHHGVMSPDLLKIDTSAVVLTGEGDVDFRDEKYRLTLKAQSKRPSLLALRGPVVVGGTFGAPVVGPAIGPVAARVGAAVGLGLLAPPLALLPLIDVGGASDVDCKALVAEARIQTATTSSLAPKAKAVAKGVAPSRSKLASGKTSGP